MTINLRVRRFLAPLLAWLLWPVTTPAASVSLAWNPSPANAVVGYGLYYGLASGLYSSFSFQGTNLTATVGGLAPGLTYYFAVTAYNSYGGQSLYSGELSYRVPLPPSIITQPVSQMAALGATVSLAASVVGDPPLTYQWINGQGPISGATASTLVLPQFSNGNLGNYDVVISNPWGSVTSVVATLTVGNPPLIVTEPQSQTVIATTPASFSASVSGTAPLSLQWYYGATAISGATNNTLTLPGTALSNAGSYSLMASNPVGVVSSSAATLTVLPTNTIATVAGVYNGLFFQTNANGTPAITESTAGFLGNCVMATNGAYTAKLNIGGASYPLAGIFNISGTATATIPFVGPLLSSVTVVLQLDLFNGTRQITGAVSGNSLGGPWIAPLLGDLATNAFPQLVGANLIIAPGTSANAPTNYGRATGIALNGILTLAGALGDTAAIAEAVPISKDGNVPVYVNLYTNGGLLEGWLNVAGAVPTGNLTWIRPLGVLAPAGFPLGFNTMVQVTGATYNQGVGFIGASGPGTYSFVYLTSSTSGWIVFQDGNGNQYYKQASGSGFTVTANGSLTFWACAGNNNPTPSGVITIIYIGGNCPTLTSMDIGGLAGLQMFTCENQSAITSINASGCVSLTSLNCADSANGININVSNCMSLTSINNTTTAATIAVQNVIIATLPAFINGTHTLYWGGYAPTNPAGDAAAVAKGWTVNRTGG